MQNRNDKEILNIIDQTITDTRYIKDQATPCSNISKTFLVWSIFYTLSSLILYLYQTIGNYFLLFEHEWFFSVSRVLNLSLFTLLLIPYFLIINKKGISLKERDFLKFYSIIPISLIFARVIFPLSYYINSDILINLYNTLSLDLLILIFSAFIIDFYFKEKFSKRLILFNVFIYIANMIFFSLYVIIDTPSPLLIDINTIITTCRDNGAFVILHFVTIIILLKKALKSND